MSLRPPKGQVNHQTESWFCARASRQWVEIAFKKKGSFLEWTHLWTLKGPTYAIQVSVAIRKWFKKSEHSLVCYKRKHPFYIPLESYLIKGKGDIFKLILSQEMVKLRILLQ